MYDVAIIGGGMAGASLACGLAQAGMRVALAEKNEPAAGAAPAAYDDRGIALSLASRRIYEQLGLWPRLAPGACPIQRIHVSAQGCYGAVRLSAAQAGLEALGYVVSARELGRVLYAALDEHDIDLFRPATAAAIAQDADLVTVRLAPGAARNAPRCRVLVVADGALSRTRELLGITAQTHDYRQAAIVGNVALPGGHHHTACERFTPQGLAALLPLADNRCVAVIAAPREQADDWLRLDDDAYLERLRHAFGNRLGRFEAPGARKSYPLVRLRAERQVSGRCVLLGAAAHAVHPNGAQGFNLVLRDIAELSAALAAAQCRGADPGAGDVLAAYVRARRSDQRRVIRFTDGLHRAFRRTGPLTALARGAALWALDALPPLKNEFIRRAAGCDWRAPGTAPASGGS